MGKRNYNKIRILSLSLLLGLTLAAGFSFAWNATWHGTRWIQSGKIIGPREIAENFEYLKQELDNLKAAVNNLPGANASSSISVDRMPSGTIIAGCLNVDNYTTRNTRCWGGAQITKFGNRRYTKCPPSSSRYSFEASVDKLASPYRSGYTYEPSRPKTHDFCVKN